MKALKYSDRDLFLNEMITNDLDKIIDQVGGQQGMYDNFPIVRYFKDNGFIRAYALDGYGGIVIVKRKVQEFYQILTLGEDDAWFFLNSSNVYQNYQGKKCGFIQLISEALSIFNNNI